MARHAAALVLLMQEKVRALCQWVESIDGQNVERSHVSDGIPMT